MIQPQRSKLTSKEQSRKELMESDNNDRRGYQLKGSQEYDDSILGHQGVGFRSAASHTNRPKAAYHEPRKQSPNRFGPSPLRAAHAHLSQDHKSASHKKYDVNMMQQ